MPNSELPFTHPPAGSRCWTLRGRGLLKRVPAVRRQPWPAGPEADYPGRPQRPESRRRTGYGRLDATPSRSVHAQPAGPRRKEGQTDRCSSAAHSLRSGHAGHIERTLDQAPSRDIAAQCPAGQWIDARIREDWPQSENKVAPPTRPLCSACRLSEGGDDACFTRPSAFCTSAETSIRANTKAHELWLTGARPAQFRLTPCKTGEPDGGWRLPDGEYDRGR